MPSSGGRISTAPVRKERPTQRNGAVQLCLVEGHAEPKAGFRYFQCSVADDRIFAIRCGVAVERSPLKS
jgi:hypothetical protein